VTHAQGADQADGDQAAGGDRGPGQDRPGAGGSLLGWVGKAAEDLHAPRMWASSWSRTSAERSIGGQWPQPSYTTSRADPPAAW
jgi:hypothetical protein